MKICIDPGHGWRDSGATAHELEEADYNLIVGSMVSCMLRQLGHSVIQTRAFDEFIELGERSAFANREHCDLFVSVHVNAATNPKAEGMEVYYLSEAGRVFADVVLDSMVDYFPHRVNRGIKKARFSVLRRTIMPAILIECGFVTNPESADFLKNEDAQVGMATAIARGVDNYCGGKYV